MTTSYRNSPGYFADLEALEAVRMAATLADAETSWKAYGRGAFGQVFFIRFGAPGSYSRDVIREIAVRIFERHPNRPSLQAIRRDDVKRAPWVPAGQFWGKQPAGTNYGIHDGGYEK